MVKKNTLELSDEDLFGPCGMFCGFCGSYLAKKYQVPRRRGIISYCDGCRPRNKQCSFLKKKCTTLLNNDVHYCNECVDYPCAQLQKINNGYLAKANYTYNFLEHLELLRTQGATAVFAALKRDHGCPTCGEILCIHNGLCYHCDQDTLATMKNYRNDP